MTNIGKWFMGLGWILLAAGCAQEANRPGDLPGSTATAPGASSERVLAAAENVLEYHAYQIASVDTARGVVISTPREYTAKESVASISDVLVPSNHTFRKIVTVRAIPAPGGGSSVSVRVDVQRHDTKAYENFAYTRQNDDRPNNTPMFQRASVNREKGEVWTPIRRDYSEEQSLLEEIRAKAGGTTRPSGPAAARPQGSR